MDLAILLSGIAAGAILFHTAIIAPTIFKTLGAAEVKIFLRAVFPKLFNLLVFIGIIMLVLFFFGMGSIYVALTTTILPLVCGKLVPATNKARDEGNDIAFKRLHSISIVLTVVVLLSNLSWIIHTFK